MLHPLQHYWYLATFALKAESGYSLYNSSSTVYTTDHPNGCVGVKFPSKLDANMNPASSAIITIDAAPCSVFIYKNTYTNTAEDFCTIALSSGNGGKLTVENSSSYTNCVATPSGTGVNFK